MSRNEFERQNRQFFPLDIRKKIEHLADKITHQSEQEAQAEVGKLNAYLEQEGYLGVKATLHTRDPIVGIAGIDRMPEGDSIELPDRTLMDSDTHVGTFVGVGIATYVDDEASLNYPTYTLMVGEDMMTVEGITDVSRLYEADQEPESVLDDTELFVAGAFAVLEEVVDERHLELVHIFRRLFYDTDSQDKVERLRLLGDYASQLYTHMSSNELSRQALKTLLRYAIDEDVEYKIAGLTIGEVTDDEHRYSDIQAIQIPIAAKPNSVTLVDFVGDFDITMDGQAATIERNYGQKQPVYILHDQANQNKLIMPLRHLTHLKESIEVRLRISCGDATRKYMAAVAVGEVSLEDVSKKYLY